MHTQRCDEQLPHTIERHVAGWKTRKMVLCNTSHCVMDSDHPMADQRHLINMEAYHMLWIIMAVLSALFAGITSILAKCGIQKTDSDVATGLRTVVVLIFSWIMVFIVGSFNTITQIEGKSLLFLILSGFATGASWICYFKALSVGDINKVVPVDKSSTILTIILAIVLFGEKRNLPVKLFAAAMLAAGIFLMIQKKNTEQKETGSSWFPYALGSAVFAALTSILAKVGISGVESNLATAIRTGVVLLMAWIIIFVKGKQTQLKNIDRKELLFIVLSGLATGASWLCYYYAIQNGIVSVVVPIDKMSILVTIIFSYFVFHETLHPKEMLGLLLMVCGTLIMTIWG